MRKEKVVLAYSGGLDTSCILVWLIENNYDANIGQEEDFDEARAKATKLGAIKVIISDLRDTFLKDYILPLLQSGAMYERRYFMGTAIARPCIAHEMVKIAKEEGATAVSHGATGKGNDQVRFELAFYALLPNVNIVAPWKIPAFYERFCGRPELFEYAKLKGVPLPQSLTPKTPWSVDSNLMHNSYESGLLEDPYNMAPKNLYQLTHDPFVNLAGDHSNNNGNNTELKVLGTPNIPDEIEIYFKAGVPNRLIIHSCTDDVTCPPKKVAKVSSQMKEKIIENDLLSLYCKLNELASLHGIGRIDIVENRFIGMKSRGIYETPGYQILYEAYRDLEMLVLDREVLKIKRYLSDVFADQIYNGFWFSPECEYTRACLRLADKNLISGSVKLRLFKGHIYIQARQPERSLSLYDKDLVSMDIKGDYNPIDAQGFIKINALRLKAHQLRKERLNIEI